MLNSNRTSTLSSIRRSFSGIRNLVNFGCNEETKTLLSSTLLRLSEGGRIRLILSRTLRALGNLYQVPMEELFPVAISHGGFPAVGEHVWTELTKLFEDDEVVKAFQQMGALKSPRRDGFHPIFFERSIRRCLGPSLTKLMLSCMVGRVDTLALREGLLLLSRLFLPSRSILRDPCHFLRALIRTPGLLFRGALGRGERCTLSTRIKCARAR
ncbi:hypothetical protein V2J09_010563 [Rumex salicifolius]